MNEAMPLTLTYDSFAHFWNALVSRRKAKRLDVNKDTAWAQLRSEGVAAPFLQAAVARKEAKKARRDEDPGKESDEKAKKKRSKPSAEAAAKTGSAPRTKKPAARKAAKSAKTAARRRAKSRT